MHAGPKRCIVIGGPTASGKTAIAIALAEKYNTAVLSADSRQCFRELNIGVAKPDVAELSRVKHYFIDTHSIHEPVTAADFERYALSVAKQVFETSDTLIVCGGTGLYIKAFLEGLDDIPEPTDVIRNEVRTLYSEHGITGLHSALKSEDVLFFEKGEIQNPQRAMRALEVMRTTGRSVLSYRSEKPLRDFLSVKYMVDLSREELYARINLRTNAMKLAGLTAEARTLLPNRALNALQTVGYAELFEHFDGKLSEDNAYALIAQHTRNYAKRQLTWFRKEGFETCTTDALLKI